MAQKQNWQPPSSPINAAPPNDFVPESERNADWYTGYARWIVSTFYNQPITGYVSQSDNIKGVAQEYVENYMYSIGAQENYRFKYATTDFSGNELPSVWIPGGKIGSLIDHMRGVMLRGIENIEVTAKNLSKGIASEKAIMREKLMVQYQMRDIMSQLPQGVTLNPIDDPEASFDSVEEIDKYVESWQDKYAIMAEKIGQSQLFIDGLRNKFLKSATTQFIGGINANLAEVMNGAVVNTTIPGYEIIWDNRNDDDFNSQALLCGYVKHGAPYQEVINRFKNDLDPTDIEEIRNLAISGYDNIEQFYSFYNTSFGWNNQFRWWNKCGTSQMTLAYATVYFIAPKDWGYKKVRNRFGAERYTKIDPNIEYTVGEEKKKGTEINGDFSGWAVYQATLIGNKYIVAFGRMKNALRDKNEKGRPLLPMQIFCGNMEMGRGLSVVGKLKDLQDQLDRYAFKIQEKVENDWGKNYVFNGSKLDGETPTVVANNLKSFHVHIAKGNSGENDDPTNAQRMVESIDMTLDNNIIRYIELSNVINLMMEERASVNRVQLGQQTTTIGKAVQQNTINQSSYGTAALYSGIMEHFNRVIQYNVNMKQMLYQFSDSVEEELIIGKEGNFLLKITDPAEFGTQRLQTYLETNSSLDDQQKADIRTIALSMAQNGKFDVIDYIEHILLAPTANQTVAGLKFSANKQNKENLANGKAQMQAEMQHEADLAKQAAMLEASLIQVKQDNENYRAEIKVFTERLDMVLQLIANKPAESPLTTAMDQPAQPPVNQPPI